MNHPMSYHLKSQPTFCRTNPSLNRRRMMTGLLVLVAMMVFGAMAISRSRVDYPVGYETSLTNNLAINRVMTGAKQPF